MSKSPNSKQSAASASNGTSQTVALRNDPIVGQSLWTRATSPFRAVGKSTFVRLLSEEEQKADRDWLPQAPGGPRR